MTPEDFAKLVAKLPQADSLDQYRLEYVIRQLYDEPRRKVAARARIHLGMTVEYFDNRDGAFHRGKIGDRVSFTDHDMRMLVGTVVRVNAKSISVAADGAPGHWRVSPGLLTHLIDA